MVIRGRSKRTRSRRAAAKPRTRSTTRAEAELELRLATALQGYALDVPQDSFPTFLETLYFDAPAGELTWTI